MNDQEWSSMVDVLDYAFQPIVSINTGVCLGLEALLRGWDAAGFASIQEIFDTAFVEKKLFHVELALREKAVRKFAGIPFHAKLKLFFNIDNRVLRMPDYSSGSTARILERFGIPPDTVVLELSEKHDLNSHAFSTDAALNSYRKQTYRIAIDDFGTGYSGLQLLYNSEPDFIKIDRFFIAGIEADSRKRLFVGKVVNLAHTLGIMVIAEGVETGSEYICCKDIGCDHVQGFLVQKPTLELMEIAEKYDGISRLASADRRDKSHDQALLSQEMEYLEPIHLHAAPNGGVTDMAAVFESFRKYRSRSFFPVINGNDAPLGLVRESGIKEYVYSKYGKDLLLNRGMGKTLLDFVVRCPIADVNTRIENILEYFSLDGTAEGVILTDNGRYAGFLSARSLLRVIYEKNIAVARDQNPLTRLPGNTLIAEFLERTLDDKHSSSVIAYFDLDNFKAFNDSYGFRQGDRAILLFSDILKEAANARRCFIGHVGGDDFFAGFSLEDFDLPHCLQWIHGVIDKFCFDVLSLYEPRDRLRGFIVSTDRDGEQSRFPLLGASAAVVQIPERARDYSVEQIGAIIAGLKRKAKDSPEKTALMNLCARAPSSQYTFVADEELFE